MAARINFLHESVKIGIEGNPAVYEIIVLPAITKVNAFVNNRMTDFSSYANIQAAANDTRKLPEEVRTVLWGLLAVRAAADESTKPEAVK
jgi:hypothetical protein